MEDGAIEAEHILHPGEETPEEKEAEEEKGGGGGLLDHIINSLVSPREEAGHKDNGGGGEIFQAKNGRTTESEKGNFDEENGKLKDEEDGSGTSIVHNLVSHLPKTLPDGAAPTTEEASILIHSIVHD